MAKAKRIKPSGVQKAEKKTPRSISLSKEDGKISWQFSTMDMDGPFRFNHLKPETWRKILDRLKHLDARTWAEVTGDRDHPIAVEILEPKAQKRLQEIQRDDTDAVFSFHLEGEPRIIGIRVNTVFQVLWWDPNHEVCKSHKKHT